MFNRKQEFTLNFLIYVNSFIGKVTFTEKALKIAVFTIYVKLE